MGDTTLAKVRELVPGIRGAAAEIRSGRQVPTAIVADLKTAGVFRMPMPKSWGGPELSPLEQLDVLEGTASNDYSVTDAWIPDEHGFNVLRPALRSEPLYRLSWWFAIKVAAVPLGLVDAIGLAWDSCLAGDDLLPKWWWLPPLLVPAGGPPVAAPQLFGTSVPYVALVCQRPVERSRAAPSGPTRFRFVAPFLRSEAADSGPARSARHRSGPRQRRGRTPIGRRRLGATTQIHIAARRRR
jgi:hypothetical protein